MFIYNITIQISWPIHDAWLTWMREEYCTMLMETGCFSRHQLVRLLEIDEEEGPTYALQLYIKNKENYHRFIAHFLPETEAISYEKWASDVIFFSTLMEIIE